MLVDLNTKYLAVKCDTSNRVILVNHYRDGCKVDNLALTIDEGILLRDMLLTVISTLEFKEN